MYSSKLCKLSSLLLVLSILSACGGGGSSDSGGGTIPPATNLAPSANAGIDQSVDENTEVTLSGSGTDSDGSVSSYSWEQTSGTSVTLANDKAATASYTAPDINADETLAFKLTVTDDDGATSSDSVNIFTQRVNQLPTVNAGEDHTVDEQTEITLSSAVNDIDGSISEYVWTQVSGDVYVPFQGNTTNNFTFTSPKTDIGDLTLTFRLSVTDNENGTSSDDVVVQVIDLPSAAEEIDSDGDGVPDVDDLFPSNILEYADSDLDGLGDNTDNCPFTANPEQSDTNSNGVGDLCEREKVLVSGVFLDSPTSGLYYTNNNGVYGTTNVNGSFQCYSGDTVIFSVGENGPSLGQTQCNELVSPFELNEGDESFDNYTRAVSIARLLQSLDEDNNPSNGITITPNTIERMTDTSFSLNTKDEFETELVSWLDANQDLDLRIVTLADAVSHVRDTLENNPLFINQVCEYYSTGLESKLKQYNPAPNCNAYKMSYLFDAYIAPQYSKEIQLIQILQDEIVSDVKKVKDANISLVIIGNRINDTISNAASFDKLSESGRGIAAKLILQNTVILNEFVEDIMPFIMESADLTDSDKKQIEQYRQLTTKTLSFILKTESCYQSAKEDGGLFNLKCTDALIAYIATLKKLIATYDIDDNDKKIYYTFLDNIVVTLKAGKSITLIANIFIEYDELISNLPDANFKNLKNIAKGKDILKLAASSKQLIDLALIPKNKDETVSNDIRNGISDTLGNVLNTAGCWLPAKDGYSFQSKSKACINAVTGVAKQAINGLYAINATFRLDNVSELRNNANISYDALNTYVLYGGNLDLMQKANYPLSSLTIADEILYLEEISSRLSLENGWIFTDYNKSQLIDDFDDKLYQLLILNGSNSSETDWESVLVVDAPSRMFVNQLYQIDLKANIYVPYFNNVLDKDASGIRVLCSSENSNYSKLSQYEYIHQLASRDNIVTSFELEMLQTGVSSLMCEVRSSSSEGGRILSKRNITIAVVEPSDSTDLDENALKVVKGVSFSDLTLAKCVQSHVDTTGINNLADLQVLSCNDQQIINAQGLEFLTGLNSLDLSRNSLTKIDLSTLTNLEKLNLTENSLTEINVTTNTQLEELNLSFNQLESVDLQSNVNLTFLNVGNNKLQTLDISKNKNIISLSASSNQLKEIDLTNNTVLVELDLMFNEFQNININNNVLLQVLLLSNNSLNEIDLSNNTELTNLLINSNNLTTIAIPQTAPLEHLRIDDNPLTQATIDYLLALPGYGFSWEVPENGTPEVVSIIPLAAYVDTPTPFTITGINFPETMSAEIQGALCDEKVLVSSTSYTMMCQSDTEGDSTLTVYEIEDLVMANGTHSIEITDIPVVPPTLIPKFIDLNPRTVISGTSDVLFAVSGTNLPNTLAMALEHSDTCTSVTLNSAGTAATITCDIPETELTQLKFYVKNKPGAEGGDIITGANNLTINITQPDVAVAYTFDYPLGHKGIDDNGAVIEFSEQLSIESNSAYETQIGIEDNHSRSCNGDNTECSADYVSSSWRNAQDVGSYYSYFTGLHPGEDWNKGSSDSDAGEPVYAVANGELFGIRSSYSTPQKGAWTIAIKHTLQDSSEIYSVYTHVTALSEVDGAISSNTDSFSLPQAITKGQMIGRIAKGNNSVEGMTLSPSHLHFELRNKSPGTISDLWNTQDGYASGYFQTANDSASIIAGMISMQNLGVIDPSDFIKAHRTVTTVPNNNIVLGVTFIDAAFAACVQEHVTAQASSALADLTLLDCSNRNIVNVSELSYMTGLVSLDLHDNPIVEINLDANQALNTVNLQSTDLSQTTLDYLATVNWVASLNYSSNEPPQYDTTSFITIWRVEDNQQITIPVNYDYEYDYTVDWGDGSPITTENGYATHEYTSAGEYTVKIAGTFPVIELIISSSKDLIFSIEQWGNIQWQSMRGAFANCVNLKINAVDAPDLTAVTDMSFMFYKADAFNGDLSNWDVSSVTNMFGLFYGAQNFNSDLSNWDVSAVTNMGRMFYYAESFNSDLSNWDVSSVTNMGGLFYVTQNFNGDLSNWDVSSVTDMRYMFDGLALSNSDLSNWDVSSVTNMEGMFYGISSFNDDISNWDVSAVTNMSSMFSGSRSFNGDLSNWDVSAVTDMSFMFFGSDSFNGDISNWDVSAVTDMSHMFYQAESFNGDLSSWDVSAVTDMRDMFYGISSFNDDISNWDVSAVTNMEGMFYGSRSFNGDLSNWDVSAVTNMEGMFYGSRSFNGDLSSWDVSGVTDMSFMFYGSDSFNGDISNWAVSAVTDMESMFAGASTFDGDLSSWDVSAVTDMNSMFYNADSFNGDISNWAVSAVTDMSYMFYNADSFNGDISNWDVSKVESHEYFSNSGLVTEPIWPYTVSEPNLVAEINVEKTEYSTGESINFTGVFRNIGDDSTPQANLTFYNSEDNVITATDTEIVIGEFTFLLLPDEVKTTNGYSIGTSGEYYFGVCVEVIAGESNTGDNCSNAIQIVVN
ncbi:BspA family leucine-rich repeat surface protein [Colwellia sp. BRX8-9]|uniref:BspA family leucine-rich repeat surface protein n=1 Tax=Colwellia sp. BRX8-9 TaxID=2759831 RepID=UPI0015F76A6A|nr:BspA family leucine-rich repeat surface protein [Colwellia sp. BRX8-9]MBA6348122.1 BspA family leucine-rich repeat surface protein [Colwellia sp. BRX8-9]